MGTAAQTCCLFTLLCRLFVYFMLLDRLVVFVLLCKLVVYLHCCAYLLFIFTAFPTSCLFVLLNKRAGCVYVVFSFSTFSNKDLCCFAYQL